jgi:predicted pyridoxine 5'-phosphate oxidase superfamily flavin-nucleotide-binding protein
MGVLTTEIKEFVKKQKLGFIATVCPDGTPNLSPKGTTTATFASAIFSKLKENKQVSTYINRICGLTLIGLGIKVALTERK